MYETCTEGTPISPVMDSLETLARWLADNGASAFGEMTATYEQWLKIIGGNKGDTMDKYRGSVLEYTGTKLALPVFVSEQGNPRLWSEIKDMVGGILKESCNIDGQPVAILMEIEYKPTKTHYTITATCQNCHTERQQFSIPVGTTTNEFLSSDKAVCGKCRCAVGWWHRG